MCTVLLRLDPAARWPLVLGAIRDEFVARAWDPPAHHWSGPWRGLAGGRDRTAGGTWLAVDPSPARPAVAALLNGHPRDLRADGTLDPARAARPTRRELALRALAGEALPAGDALAAYDRFHLLVATTASARLWSWDGADLVEVVLDPGPHIVVNDGLDTPADPLVPHFAPLLAAVGEPDPAAESWGGWAGLLAGDGLPGDDERALVVAKEIDGRPYGTTSAALVALGRDGRVRYDFSADPTDPAGWAPVGLDVDRAAG